MELIPANVLQRLPLVPQPIATLDADSDLAEVLLGLHSSSDASYAKELFVTGTENGQRIAREFSQVARDARPVPAAEGNVEDPPDFANDPAFGRALKSLVAWRALVGCVLAEEAFFSLAHILETEADLEASFHLAGQLYYKHALQVLRAFLENVTLPLLLCRKQPLFTKWRLGTYRIPNLGGDDGVLRQLVTGGVLTQVLADRVYDAYNRLNGAIHATERRLIHRGSASGPYRGKVFKRDDFDEWCNNVAELVAIGAELLAINVRQWQPVRMRHPVMCSTCHNTDEFVTVRDGPYDGALVAFHCLICGDNFWQSAAAEAWFGAGLAPI